MKQLFCNITKGSKGKMVADLLGFCKASLNDEMTW